jgi:hypothetical protein
MESAVNPVGVGGDMRNAQRVGYGKIVSVFNKLTDTGMICTY